MYINNFSSTSLEYTRYKCYPESSYCHGGQKEYAFLNFKILNISKIIVEL